MYWSGVALVLSVGVLNVLLNVWARKSAVEADTWASGFLSWKFGLTFLIGCGSLLALYTLYYSKINLGRAILLMGVVSIVGGTLYGIVVPPRHNPDTNEYVILGSIFAFFLYRMTLKP